MPYYGGNTTCNKLVGYSIRERVPARSSLEELLPVYFFDSTVSDYQIKFVQRGCKSPIIIEYDDLAAVMSIEEIVPPYTITLPEENTLPKEMDLRYLSPLNNFQTAQQRYSRHSSTTTSVDKETISTFIALEDSYAKETIVKILINAWENAKKLKIVLPKKYLRLDPTDLIQINTKEGTSIVARIVEIINNYNTLEITAEFENRINYAPIKYIGNNFAYFNTSGDQKIPLAASMVSIVMDSYPLNDVLTEYYEELSYIYVSGGAYFSNWPGGDIIISQNDVDYVPAAFIKSNTVLGSVISSNVPLNNIKNTYYVDLETEIDVIIYNNTTNFYTNLSYAELFSSTKNTFFISNPNGGEFIRAQNITSLGDKKYRLSNILRGLYHSYNNIPYYDGSQSDIVLIELENILKGDMEYGLYDNTYYYKSVTMGVDEDSVPSESFFFKAKWAGASPASNIISTRRNNDIEIKWYSTSNFSSPVTLGTPDIPVYKEKIKIYDSNNNLLLEVADIVDEGYTFSPTSVSKTINDIFIFKVQRYSVMKEYNTEERVNTYIPSISSYFNYASPEILYLFSNEPGAYTVTDEIGVTSSNLVSNSSLLDFKNSIFRNRLAGTLRLKAGQYLETNNSTFGSSRYNFSFCLALNINRKTNQAGDIPFINREVSGRNYTIDCNSYKFLSNNLDIAKAFIVVTVSGDSSSTIESVYINNILLSEEETALDLEWSGNLKIGNFGTIIPDFDVSIELFSYYNNTILTEEERTELYRRYRELL